MQKPSTQWAIRDDSSHVAVRDSGKYCSAVDSGEEFAKKLIRVREKRLKLGCLERLAVALVQRELPQSDSTLELFELENTFSTTYNEHRHRLRCI